METKVEMDIVRTHDFVATFFGKILPAQRRGQFSHENGAEESAK